jgi:D-alanyl-D-alanine carboxypeptidase
MLGLSTGRAAFALALIAALGSEAMMPPQAAADPMVPTVIADADTGEVLHSEQATRPWYPASTTKLMTAYAALRAVRAGEIKFDTPIVVSAHAARQPPSKIGVRPGQEITLENALKILMVKSANDISVVVAEGVGGSVQGFAALMNREAARLGMRESHFVNPHGLHSPNQVTSARDMALLARALLLEFPEYRDLFSISAVQIGSRVHHNTNGLIGR